MSIEVSHLFKSYGTQRAVNDVSFSVGRGEVVGFLGPNGAGKSTTMKMLTGYLRPDSGEISICGHPIASRPLEVKKNVGYLPESNPLYTDMYIREYLELMAGVHGLKDLRDSTQRVIEITGLQPEARKRVGELSKGYRQRVGLAAALIHDPEVLILDEPTSGLDPNQIIEIRQVIQNFGREKTILFSSHILQEVEALCERVIIINKGSVVADDRIDSLQEKMTGHTLRVRFNEPAEETLFAGLQGIVERHTKDGLEWALQTNDPDSLRRDLLSAALQRGLNVVSLQTERGSLEEVFKSLTNRP